MLFNFFLQIPYTKISSNNVFSFYLFQYIGSDIPRYLLNKQTDYHKKSERVWDLDGHTLVEKIGSYPRCYCRSSHTAPSRWRVSLHTVLRGSVSPHTVLRGSVRTGFIFQRTGFICQRTGFIYQRTGLSASGLASFSSILASFASSLST